MRRRVHRPRTVSPRSVTTWGTVNRTCNHLVTRAYPYRQLARSEFDQIIAMLAEGIAAGKRGRYGAYLYRDRVHGRVRARRAHAWPRSRSGGAIPDSGPIHHGVFAGRPRLVGTLDEDFAVESNAGDIICSGNTFWRIRRVRGFRRTRPGRRRTRSSALGAFLARRSTGANPGIVRCCFAPAGGHQLDAAAGQSGDRRSSGDRAIR